MEADWTTIYREACIAGDAQFIVSDLWLKAECGSEVEELLQSVSDYLMDRFNVALEFCNLISDMTTAKVTSETQEFDDIPF